VIELVKKFDIKIINIINKKKHSLLDKIMFFLTVLGNAGTIWIIVIMFFLLTKNSTIAFKLSLSLLSSAWLGNIVIKPLFERKRPYQVYQDLKRIPRKINDYSFPSGHSITSFSVATTMFFIDPIIGSCFYFLALFIAYSRIYLNMHYFSDIVIGALLGIIVGAFIFSL